MPVTHSLNSQFYKKKEFIEENSIYSFKPIKEAPNKKIVLLLVRVKFL